MICSWPHPHHISGRLDSNCHPDTQIALTEAVGMPGPSETSCSFFAGCWGQHRHGAGEFDSRVYSAGPNKCCITRDSTLWQSTPVLICRPFSQCRSLSHRGWSVEHVSPLLAGKESSYCNWLFFGGVHDLCPLPQLGPGSKGHLLLLLFLLMPSPCPLWLLKHSIQKAAWPVRFQEL